MGKVVFYGGVVVCKPLGGRPSPIGWGGGKKKVFTVNKKFKPTGNQGDAVSLCGVEKPRKRESEKGMGEKKCPSGGKKGVSRQLGGKKGDQTGDLKQGEKQYQKYGKRHRGKEFLRFLTKVERGEDSAGLETSFLPEGVAVGGISSEGSASRGGGGVAGWGKKEEKVGTQGGGCRKG